MRFAPSTDFHLAWTQLCPRIAFVVFGPTSAATRITLGRLLACPVFVVLFYLAIPRHGSGTDLQNLIAESDPVLLSMGLFVLLLQEASDIIDGWLARATGVVTDLGKLLDPLADTLVHVGTLLCLMWIGLIPLWLLVVVYYREAIVGTLRVIAAKRGVVIGARITGKLKSIALGGAGSILVFLLILAHEYPAIPVAIIAQVFSFIIGAIAVISGIDYTLAIRRTLLEADGGPE